MTAALAWRAIPLTIFCAGYGNVAMEVLRRGSPKITGPGGVFTPHLRLVANFFRVRFFFLVFLHFVSVSCTLFLFFLPFFLYILLPFFCTFIVFSGTFVVVVLFVFFVVFFVVCTFSSSYQVCIFLYYCMCVFYGVFCVCLQGWALVRYVLAGVARGVGGVLIVYVRPTLPPHDVAETHQNARVRKRGCKADYIGRRGE